MEQRQRQETRFDMHMAILAANLRDASVGAEVLSAIMWIGLAVIQIGGWPGTSSLLVRLIGDRFPGYLIAVLLMFGVLHLVCFFNLSVVPYILVRKVLSLFGALVWASVVYDLVVLGQIGGTLVFGGLLLLLVYAVLRRRYLV